MIQVSQTNSTASRFNPKQFSRRNEASTQALIQTLRQSSEEKPPLSAPNWGSHFLTFSKKLRILITAGGTKENIDPVRFITNFSTGSLGRAFGEEAAKRGHQVTLLAPKETPLLTGGPLAPGIDHRPYRSTEDLEKALKTAAEEGKWDVVIHSAAVSDYRPAESKASKISSDQDELVIRMVKTPKLIGSMRQWFGRAFLVGFKLLSGVDPKQRHQIALAQIHKNRTNLCVENDLTEVSSKSHKARLVTPEGGAIPIPVGSKTDVAKSVLDFIEKREDVRWFQTIFSEKIPAQLPPTGKALASQLLKVAQSSGLLVDSSGNLSVKRPKGFMMISPRGGNKAILQPEQMMLVKVNQKTRKIYTSLSRAIVPPTLTGFTGTDAANPLKPQKPSIDTGVSDALYKKFPKLQALLHTHSIWGVGAAKTQFPYPCGVLEEAQQIIEAKNQQDPTGEKPFLVQLVNHGLLLGLAAPLTIEKLAQQWEAVQKDFDLHMADVGATKEELTGGKLQGILSPEGFVGSVYTHQNGSVSPRLLPEYQGKGFGKDLIQIIKDQHLTIKTVPDCNVLAYYQKMGFEQIGTEGRQIYLKATN